MRAHRFARPCQAKHTAFLPKARLGKYELLHALGFDGRVKVLDFGMAKARKQRTVTLPGIV